MDKPPDVLQSLQIVYQAKAKEIYILTDKEW